MKKQYFKQPRKRRYEFQVNESVEGEPIELMMERLINNNESEMIETKEPIYTRPEDGVIGAFDMRYNWWEDAAKNSSTMAEKSIELDKAKLDKRTEMLKKKQEEEKFLKEENARKLAEKKANGAGEE